MRTKFFAQSAIDKQKLEEDVGALRRLERGQLDALREFLAEGVRLIQKDETMSEELEGFLRQSSVPPETYVRARSVCLLLLNAHEKFSDTSEGIIAGIDDLVHLGTDVRGFVSDLFPSIVRAAEMRRRSALIAKPLPMLSGVTYVCDARVDLEDFDVFRHDPECRSATPREWIPLAIVRFSTDEEDELRCQLDLERV